MIGQARAVTCDGIKQGRLGIRIGRLDREAVQCEKFVWILGIGHTAS